MNWKNLISRYLILFNYLESLCNYSDLDQRSIDKYIKIKKGEINGHLNEKNLSIIIKSIIIIFNKLDKN